MDFVALALILAFPSIAVLSFLLGVGYGRWDAKAQALEERAALTHEANNG